MAIRYTGSSGLWTMDAPVFFGGEPDENDGRKVVCWNLAPLRELYHLTTPTGKPVGFSLPSVAHNRTSFSDFGYMSVNLFE